MFSLRNIVFPFGRGGVSPGPAGHSPATPEHSIPIAQRGMECHPGQPRSTMHLYHDLGIWEGSPMSNRKKTHLFIPCVCLMYCEQDLYGSRIHSYLAQTGSGKIKPNRNLIRACWTLLSTPSAFHSYLAQNIIGMECFCAFIVRLKKFVVHSEVLEARNPTPRSTFSCSRDLPVMPVIGCASLVTALERNDMGWVRNVTLHSDALACV